MPDLEQLGRLQRRIVDLWWAQLQPEDTWDLSTITWSRVVNATFQELMVGRGGQPPQFLGLAPALVDAIVEYREALAEPNGGGWFIALQMRMNPAGEAQMRVVWNDQVWFGMHPGAPLQPPSNPLADTVPTTDMWRLELEQHPRDPERVPDWWRMLLDGAAAPQPDSSAATTARPRAGSVDEALRARITLPADVRMMDGAWGWDRYLDGLNAAVVEALRQAPDAGALVDPARNADRAAAIETIAADAMHRLITATREVWPAGTPIRLVREWNARHAQPDPEGLGAVDPAASYAEQLRTSLALKRVEATLSDVAGRLIAQNLADRLG